MKIEGYEKLICEKINKVVVGIIESNKILNISAKARAGEEISDWIEEKFVEKTQGHPFLKNTKSAPKGKTKNPWDVRTNFVLKNHTEDIWIDFKALKVSRPVLPVASRC